jgi:hypothetical protein
MSDALKLTGLALLIVVCIIVGIRYHNRHVNDCHHNGGHVTHHTAYHHGDSDTTYYCVTTDRGVIDVW